MTSSVPRNLTTGVNQNLTLSSDSGKIFAVTGLGAEGFPERKNRLWFKLFEHIILISILNKFISRGFVSFSESAILS